MSFFFGTQAQGALEDWEQLDEVKTKVRSMGLKGSDVEQPKKPAKTYKSRKKKPAARKSRPKKDKIGSITAKMARKYKQGSIEQLSGKPGKLGLLRRQKTDEPVGDSMGGSLFNSEDWSQVLSQITQQMPSLAKTRTETLSSLLEKYTQVSQQLKKDGDCQPDLWESAQVPPEMTKEDVRVLYGYAGADDDDDDDVIVQGRNERSFLESDNNDPFGPIMTLSQVVTMNRSCHSSPVPSTIADSCSDEDPEPLTLEVVEAARREAARHEVADVTADVTDEPVFLKSIQVPSSQKTEEEEGDDDDGEIVVADPPGYLGVSVEDLSGVAEIPDSQGCEDAESTPFKFLDALTTKQLKRQVLEWGLKPVRSRKEMLEVLKMTCGMLGREALDVAVKSFSVAKDECIRMSQCDGEDKKIVRSSVFNEIRRVLVSNEDIHSDILVYRPLNVGKVMGVLASEGIRFDQELVQECLDELGICFTEQ